MNEPADLAGIEYAVPLHSLTTFRIGGPARYFFTAHNEEELCHAIRWARAAGIPVFILGKGSNVLIADEGFHGLVIVLAGVFRSIDFDEQNGIVTAGAGASLVRLGNVLEERGWGGLEYMCCIPGTVGGAVYMNAGTKTGEIRDSFLDARIMTPYGEVKQFSAADMVFGHRTSSLRLSRNILLSARFRLTTRDLSAAIRERIRTQIQERNAKQPRNPRNCGSVFKSDANGVPAWKYIEGAGLRGLRVGDAMIAEEHANWIVNAGQATARDVKRLIKRIEDAVVEKFAVCLERELIIIPDDLI